MDRNRGRLEGSQNDLEAPLLDQAGDLIGQDMRNPHALDRRLDRGIGGGYDEPRFWRMIQRIAIVMVTKRPWAARGETFEGHAHMIGQILGLLQWRMGVQIGRAGADHAATGAQPGRYQAAVR